MVSNEVIEEVISSSKKGKFIDNDILIKAFLDIYEDFDDFTKQNFNGLIIGEINRKRDLRGMCDLANNKIFIDLEYSCEELTEEKNLTMFMKNLKIINTLYHESEHLKESYKKTLNNFEAKLLRHSEVFTEEQQDDLYEYIPNEKIAFANSWKFLLKNISKYPEFKDKFFEEYKFVNNEYIKHLKLGYYFDEYLEEYNIPLIYFLKETGDLAGLLELGSFKVAGTVKKSKTPAEIKLKYGLPITKQDIKEVNKQKILTRSIK